MASQNRLTSFAGNLQNVSGKLGRALEGRGTNIPDFVAFLAKPGNESAIGEIAALADRMPRVAQESTLLIPVGTVEISARTTPFVAKDHFVVSAKNDAAVKVFSLGCNFRAWFLGKSENARPASTLRYAVLACTSLDEPIIAELGGEAKAEVSLSEFYALLARQPNGESGPLLTDGHTNICYIRDASGALCAVSAWWRKNIWGVDASSVSYLGVWVRGGWVFSRNS